MPISPGLMSVQVIDRGVIVVDSPGGGQCSAPTPTRVNARMVCSGEVFRRHSKVKPTASAIAVESCVDNIGRATTKKARTFLPGRHW